MIVSPQRPETTAPAEHEIRWSSAPQPSGPSLTDVRAAVETGDVERVAEIAADAVETRDAALLVMRAAVSFAATQTRKLDQLRVRLREAA